MKGNVIASKLLDDGSEVGELVSVQLPSFSMLTNTFMLAGGEVDLPTTGKMSNAETSVKTRGMSVGRTVLARPGIHKLELRFAQDSYDVQSGMVPEGCKIFMTAVYKSDDLGSVEDNGGAEGTISYTVLRYEEIVDGKQTRLYDKVTGQNVVDGKDHYDKIKSILG